MYTSNRSKHRAVRDFSVKFVDTLYWATLTQMCVDPKLQWSYLLIMVSTGKPEAGSLLYRAKADMCVCVSISRFKENIFFNAFFCIRKGYLQNRLFVVVFVWSRRTLAIIYLRRYVSKVIEVRRVQHNLDFRNHSSKRIWQQTVEKKELMKKNEGNTY